MRAAAELSAKHINDRQLPDKAIDVLDEAGAARPDAPRREAPPPHHRPRRRAGGGPDGQDPGAHRLGRRRGRAAEPRARAEEGHLRAGPGHRGHRQRHQALALRPRRSREAHRQLPLLRPHRRGQDRARQAAGAHPGRGVHPLRHDRVPGEAHRLPAHRRAPRLRRLRPGRAAHRRHPQDALRGAAARRDREGPPGHLQPAPAGDGPRHPDRQQRPQGRLPPRGADHDHQRRRPGAVGAADRASARTSPSRATPATPSSGPSAPSSATGSTPGWPSTRCRPR